MIVEEVFASKRVREDLRGLKSCFISIISELLKS